MRKFSLMILSVIAISLLVMICISCNKVEFDPGPPQGCSTGIRDGRRQLIRCATQKEHNAGNYVPSGGTITFTKYTDWKWEPTISCDACKIKYP